MYSCHKIREKAAWLETADQLYMSSNYVQMLSYLKKIIRLHFGHKTFNTVGCSLFLFVRFFKVYFLYSFNSGLIIMSTNCM